MYCKFDFRAMTQQIKDMAVIDAITSLISDKVEQKRIRDILMVFANYGVSANEAIKILTEITGYLKEDSYNED